MSNDRPKRIRITGPVGADNVTVGEVYEVKAWSVGSPGIDSDHGHRWWCAPSGGTPTVNWPSWEPADDAPEPETATSVIMDYSRAGPTHTVSATIIDGSPIYVVRDNGGHEIAHGSLPDIEAAIKAIDAFRAKVAAGLDS